jgi:DNA primase
VSRGGSDPFVERVREASDIVEIVGASVELKRASSRWRGLCPFHGEKTPSFYVSPDYQSYHCFGCGVGGDVFSFVMAQENLTFPEALRYLAERAGIQMPDQRGPSVDRLESIRQALRVARTFYVHQLAGAAGAGARSYLERRGIGRELWNQYGLGVAPDGWDALLRHARNYVSERTLVEAGLAVEKNPGRLYDRFRNRLMIPIESAGGMPVGFGGRILADEEPKYMNSPETPVYRKGSVLFGLPQAREGIRAAGRVIVVEGYFDVLALAEGGIVSVVGTCGTALTPDQARQLGRLGVEVVLLFDGDGAGIQAAIRALPVMVGAVASVRVATPPTGQDPDDWIRNAGKPAVDRELENARTPVAFLEDQAVHGKLSRTEAAAQAVALVERLEDPLVRDLWIQEIAGRFGLSERAIVERLSGKTPAPAPRRVSGRWTPREAACLRTALQTPQRAGEIADLAEALKARAPFLEVLRWIQEQSERAGGSSIVPAELITRATRELPDGGGLAALPVGEEQPVLEIEVVLHDLSRRVLKTRMEQATREIRLAEDAGDSVGLIRWLNEKKRLSSELRALEGIASDRESRSTESDGTGTNAPVF